jgi:hypothetical protein
MSKKSRGVGGAGAARGARSESRPEPVVSATTAAKTFGSIVDRVREARASYVIERGGVPVARISPYGAMRCTLADLAVALGGGRRADEAFAREVESAVKSFNRPAVPADRWER